MDIRNLVKMANQIGDYFSSLPDREEALKEIAGHLQKFWAPRMRCQLLEYIDRHHGEGLQDMVLTSLNIHRAKLKSKV